MQLSVKCLIGLSLLLPAWGQSVTGRVTDLSGGAVANARIVAAHAASGHKIEKQTDSGGTYLLAGVAPGDWDLTVLKEGFAPVLRHVTVRAELQVDFRLQIETVAQEVVVRDRILGLAEQAREIPGSIDILDSATLTQARVFNFDEALRKAPGIYVRSEEGFGLRPNIGIRGLNPTRSSKVLLLEDGLPLTFAPYGANESYYHPPIERFDSIEVMKGAGQILYGPQTVGGVINYVNPEPPQRRSGELTLSGGTRDYMNARLKYGGTIVRTGLLFEAMRKQGRGFEREPAARSETSTSRCCTRFQAGTRCLES
jgi:Fe(3+) dicitrate transport protein